MITAPDGLPSIRLQAYWMMDTLPHKVAPQGLTHNHSGSRHGMVNGAPRPHLEKNYVSPELHMSGIELFPFYSLAPCGRLICHLSWRLLAVESSEAPTSQCFLMQCLAITLMTVSSRNCLIILYKVNPLNC